MKRFLAVCALLAGGLAGRAQEAGPAPPKAPSPGEAAAGKPQEEGLKVGDPVPEVSAVNEAGETVRLRSFTGQHGVVLFFFPKSFTPGCTTESCGFRDQNAKYAEDGYVILGASRDTPEVLKRFKEKYELPYNLLSDPQGDLAKALGVTPGARQTVVIGRDGRIEQLITQVSAKTHPEDLLAEFGHAPK